MKRKLYMLLVLYIFLSFFSRSASGYERTLKQIKIVEDHKVNIVNTYEKTVEQLLAEQQIFLKKGDDINLKLESELVDGGILEIKRAKSATLLIDKKKIEVLTTKEKVRDLISDYVDIKNKNYILHGVSEDSPIKDNIFITINNIIEYDRTVVESIPFQKEEFYTDELFEGETKIIHQGIEGKLEKVYRDTFISNNKENEVLVKTNVLELPANEVIAIGTKPKPKPKPVVKTINGLVYSKEFTMTASAYSSYETGGRYTYTGMLPRVGVVAVDPRVIPLGSKLYVEGYGQAVAGDIGGAIKGNKIDLFVNSFREAKNYGLRKVKVYLLENN